MALFPVDLQGQKVYVNAPFDVTESRLANTFFTAWDGIKNSVILHWMDVTDANGANGLAVLTDHTTSYVHGEDHPPGLVLQYSGIGLWGRRYGINGPTTVRYALIPHEGRWDQAGIAGESAAWNEPLMPVLMRSDGRALDARRSLLGLSRAGWEVTATAVEGKSLLVRFFNAAGNDCQQEVALGGRAVKVTLVELNGDTRELLRTASTPDGRTQVALAIPRFGLRTVRFDEYAP